MNYRNKALIYEIDDGLVSLDEAFNGYLERNDYIIIDTHTLAEEIGNEINDKWNDIFISEIYKQTEKVTEEIKEKIIEDIVDYVTRNYPEKYHE